MNPIPSSNSGNRAGIVTMGDGMQYLLASGEMSDARFAVGRDYGDAKIFPAHRILLGVRSAVFHAMLYGSVPENCAAPVDIPDIHPEAFANMLSFIYTDAVKILSLDNVFFTLGCADKYDLPFLVVKCTDFAVNELTTSNCLDMLDSAVLYAATAPSIVEKCLCLIDESGEAIWESEQFCEIGQEALRLILQRDTLTANEDTICWAAEEWAGAVCTRKNMDDSSANRREVLGQALFLIRFPLLTDVQLLDGPAESGLLLQSEILDIYRHKRATIKPQLPFHTEPRRNIRAEGVINFKIPDVRELPEAGMDVLYSDPITVRKLLWRIQVYKNTDGESPALSYFLVCNHCHDCSNCDSWACQATVELRVLPWKAETEPMNKPSHDLFNKEDSWGYAEYISMEELLDPAKGYVNPIDFSLKLQVRLTADLPVGIE